MLPLGVAQRSKVARQTNPPREGGIIFSIYSAVYIFDESTGCEYRLGRVSYLAVSVVSPLFMATWDH